jgi:hypothetical protein
MCLLFHICTLPKSLLLPCFFNPRTISTGDQEGPGEGNDLFSILSLSTPSSWRDSVLWNQYLFICLVNLLSSFHHKYTLTFSLNTSTSSLRRYRIQPESPLPAFQKFNYYSPIESFFPYMIYSCAWFLSILLCFYFLSKPIISSANSCPSFYHPANRLQIYLWHNFLSSSLLPIFVCKVTVPFTSRLHFVNMCLSLSLREQVLHT